MQRKTSLDKDAHEKAMHELIQYRKEREKSYRVRALKMYPHVCASCGREFDAHNLKELTVHHKDHNHDHNPPDGSNWELLCLYCHDHEHEKYLMKGFNPSSRKPEASTSDNIVTPFDNINL